MTQANPSAITFLRSTTTTRVDREADGEIDVSVTHLARFSIEAGAIPDMTHQYGSQHFRPEWAEVTWNDGELSRIALTGPRVLKSDKLSRAGHASSRNYEWSSWDLSHPDRSRKAPVPEALTAAIADYERHVAVASARAGGNA
jgi:hypothetical protein